MRHSGNWRLIGGSGLTLVVFVAAACVSVSPETTTPRATSLVAAPGATPALCLRGEYRALPTDDTPITPEAMADIRTIIENRINQFGVANPTVGTQGNDRIVVVLPGLTNEQDVRSLIGSTGRLDFVEVPPDRASEVVHGARIPEGLPVIFSGDALTVVRPAVDNDGRRAVDFELNDEGAQLFEDYTRDHVGEQFAVVLDGVVISAPTIREPIADGKGQISGGFTSATEVSQLVTVLRYGALPNDIEEVSFSQVACG